MRPGDLGFTAHSSNLVTPAASAVECDGWFCAAFGAVGGGSPTSCWSGRARARWRTIPLMTELLSAAEAARILGISRGRVIELATSDPGFPTSQPSPAGGRAWPRVAVQAWAAAHPDRGPLHRGPQLPPVGGRSSQVWKVANLAGEEAQAHNHPWIGPEHLLAALVHPDCPGAARAVLASLGITSERLEQARERSFIDPTSPPPAGRRSTRPSSWSWNAPTWKRSCSPTPRSPASTCC